MKVTISNFKETLKPLWIWTWIMGVGVIESPIDYLQPVVTLIISICRIACYSALFYVGDYWDDEEWDYYNDEFENETFSDLFNFTFISNGTSLTKDDILIKSMQYHGIFNVLYSTIICFFTAKESSTCMSRISLVDETLRKIGVRINYSKEYRANICILVVWVMGMFLSVTVAAIVQLLGYDVSLPNIVRILYEELPFCVNSTVLLSFIIPVGCIGKRFKKLNNIFRDHDVIYSERNLNMRQRPKNDKAGENDMLKNSDSETYITDDITHLLKYTRQMHLELCEIARGFNQIYGIQLLLSTSESLLVVIGCLYRFCTTEFIAFMELDNEVKYLYYSYLFKYVVSYILRLLHVSYICNDAVVEAHRMGDIIHKLDIPDADEDVSTGIQEFTLQLKQYPLAFTAYDFFEIDFLLFRGFVRATSIYLVILMQLG